jgi:predicted RecB family nuclease
VAFTEQEKTALLQLKGVGPTVIQRFEQIGLDSFEKLASHSAAEIAERVASMLRTSCWKNSPQALAAIEAAIQRSAQAL